MSWDGTGEHADYPHEDWRYEVLNGYTNLGYLEWVDHQIEADSGGES